MQSMQQHQIMSLLEAAGIQILVDEETVTVQLLGSEVFPPRVLYAGAMAPAAIPMKLESRKETIAAVTSLLQKTIDQDTHALAYIVIHGDDICDFHWFAESKRLQLRGALACIDDGLADSIREDAEDSE